MTLRARHSARDALNAFMESQGAHTPGIMVLTTGLSKVFRRLDKFPCECLAPLRPRSVPSELHAERGGFVS